MELREYGVINEDLQILKLKIKDLKIAIGFRTKSGYLNLKSNTSYGLFFEAEKLLNSLDTFMEDLSSTYTGFYNDYVTARNIRHRRNKRYSRLPN